MPALRRRIRTRPADMGWSLVRKTGLDLISSQSDCRGRLETLQL